MEIEAEALDYSVDVKLEPENAILNCGETFKASVLLKKGGQPISGQKMVVTTKWESKTVKEETIISDIFFIPFAMFVIIAVVNSVNLIDGVDGLSSSVTAVYSLATGVMLVLYVLTFNGEAFEPEAAVAASNALDGLSGLAVFAFATAGACMGFLVHNTYPAKVFMGDLGAFTLGGAVAAMALLSRTSLLLPLMGVLYVATSVSVILQVGSYKLRKKRIFRMAPLHHHFELGGTPETKIVSMYTVVTAIASAGALIIFWLCK